MLQLAWRTVLTRWPLFVAAIGAVAFGVGLLEAAVMLQVAAERSTAPTGASAQEAAAFTHAIAEVQALLGLLSGLALCLTISVVGSTMGYTVSERRRDFALLRLSGASPRQVRMLVAAEAAVIGALGGVLGVVGGGLLVPVQQALTARLDLPHLSVDPLPVWSVLIGVLIAIVLCLLGSRGPGKKAARQRPLDALTHGDTADRVMTPARWIIGILCCAGAAATATSALRGDPVLATMLGLCAIMLATIGLSRLSPVLVPPCARVLRLLGGRTVEAEVAAANLRDATRRTAATAAPLIILVGLVVGLLTLTGTLSRGAEAEQRAVVDADLIVSSPGDRTSALRGIDGVEVAAPASTLPAVVTGQVTDDPEGAPRSQQWAGNVVAVDPTSYAMTQRWSKNRDRLAALRPGQTMLGSTVSEGTISVDGLRLTTGKHRRSLTPVGDVPLALAASPDFIVSRDSVPSTVLRKAPTETLIQVRPGVPVQRVVAEIEQAGLGDIEPVPQWIAATTAGTERDNEAVMLALTAIGGVYALFAAVNAAASGVLQRRHEFAIARLTGMSRAQIVRSSVLESLVTSSIGGLLGLLVAGLAVAGPVVSIHRKFGETALVVPWSVILGLGVVSAVTVGGAVALAALRATAERPVAALARAG